MTESFDRRVWIGEWECLRPEYPYASHRVPVIYQVRVFVTKRHVSHNDAPDTHEFYRNILRKCLLESSCQLKPRFICPLEELVRKRNLFGIVLGKESNLRGVSVQASKLAKVWVYMHALWITCRRGHEPCMHPEKIRICIFCLRHGSFASKMCSPPWHAHPNTYLSSQERVHKYQIDSIPCYGFVGYLCEPGKHGRDDSRFEVSAWNKSLQRISHRHNES